VDRVGLALQGSEKLPAAPLPHTHRLIITATDNGVPIGAESDRSDPIGVSLNGLQWDTIGSMPEPDLTSCRSCRQQISVWTKRHTRNTAEGIGKHRFSQIGVGKIDLGERYPLEVGLPHYQVREIVAAQRASQLNQHIQHVPCRVTGVVVMLFAQGRKQTLEALEQRLLPEEGE